jgi:xylan 1,4-beta-xylosidase
MKYHPLLAAALLSTGPFALGAVPATAVPTQIRPGAPVEQGPIPQLPSLAPLFDYPLRDTSIARGHDGAYYLTGTTGAPDMWAVTGNIQVWRSEDLKSWKAVVQKPRERSIVWNVDRDGTWEKRIPLRDGVPFRPLWAPEIAFIKGTYWIAYSIPFGVGGGVLKSTSGKPEGPYEAVFRDQPIVDAIDLALFADDDGKVYLIWGAGNIRELNAGMNGFVGDAWQLKPANAERIGFEGTFVFKAHGRYYITGAEFVADPANHAVEDYNCYAAVGDSLHGPFGPKYLAIPHGGHNSFFADQDGNWWATIFGNDALAPFHERPGIMRIEFLPDGRFTFAAKQPEFVLRK